MSIACAMTLASMTDAELMLVPTLLVYLIPILFSAAAIYGLVRELPHIWTAFHRLYSSQQTHTNHLKEKA